MTERPRPSAFDHAVRLLGQREHFRDELARKLIQKGHPEDEVEAALSRLAALGYLDDAALAAGEAERLRERKGLGRAGVAAELRRKGAGAAAVESALAGGSAEDERERARATAERWLRTHRPDAGALARHLGRKGYARSVVYQLVAELAPNSGGSDPPDPVE